MKQKKNVLGMQEYICILFFMVGVKATEDTPSVLYKGVQNAEWMVPLLSGVIFALPLFLLIKTVSLYKEKDIFTVIQQLCGKFFGFIICLVILFITLAAISLDSRSYTNIIGGFYFPTTPILVIYGILMMVCAYGAKKGLQHIGSVARIVFFYASGSFGLALLLSLKYSSIQSIFPIMGPGITEIVKVSTFRTTFYADFFLLTLVIPFIKTIKEYKKGTWMAYGLVILQLGWALLFFVCLFDTSLGEQGYPFHSMIRFISLGNFLQNIEMFFFPIWIMAAFVRFAASLYIVAFLFGNIFKIKDFEYLIPSFAVIFLLLGYIPETPYEVAFLKSKIQMVAGPAFMGISILLWLVALLKGEFKDGKHKNSV